MNFQIDEMPHACHMGLYTHLIIALADSCDRMLHLKGISRLNVYKKSMEWHEQRCEALKTKTKTRRRIT